MVFVFSQIPLKANFLPCLWHLPTVPNEDIGISNAL